MCSMSTFVCLVMVTSWYAYYAHRKEVLIAPKSLASSLWSICSNYWSKRTGLVLDIQPFTFTSNRNKNYRLHVSYRFTYKIHVYISSKQVCKNTSLCQDPQNHLLYLVSHMHAQVHHTTVSRISFIYPMIHLIIQ